MHAVKGEVTVKNIGTPRKIYKIKKLFEQIGGGGEIAKEGWRNSLGEPPGIFFLSGSAVKEQQVWPL